MMDPYEKRAKLSQNELTELTEQLAWNQVLGNSAMTAQLTQTLRNHGRKRSFLDLNGQNHEEAVANMKTHLKMAKDNDWDVILLLTSQKTGQTIVDHLRNIHYQYKWERPNHEVPYKRYNGDLPIHSSRSSEHVLAGTDLSLIMVCLKTKQIVLGAKSVTITDPTNHKRIIDYTEDIRLMDANPIKDGSITSAYYKLIDKTVSLNVFFLILSFCALIFVVIARRYFWKLLFLLLLSCAVFGFLTFYRKKGDKAERRRLRMFLAVK